MASNYVLQIFSSMILDIYRALQTDVSVQGVIQVQSQTATGLFCHAVKNCAFIVVVNSAFCIATNVLC